MYLDNFVSGELVNSYEMKAMEILKMVLGDNFVYFAEYPLQKICYRPPNADVFLLWNSGSFGSIPVWTLPL